MVNIIISEKQLEVVTKHVISEKTLSITRKKWESLSEENQRVIKNIAESLYPNEKEILSEAWWNTIGDVLGIFDPTGVVDLINGLDYIRQGDYFFGFLSMIAIIPYAGDVIAKPIMGISKGSKMMKGVNRAMSIVKQGGNTAEASKILIESGKTSKLLSKLINNSIVWGDKLKKLLDKIPGGKLVGGLKKTITDWIDLFINVARRRKNIKGISINFASKINKADPETALKLANSLKKELRKNGQIFKDFKLTDPSFMSKYIWPTFALSYRNRELLSLMRRTKFYAGLLDFIGVANFVGPEELSKSMGEKEFKELMSNYSKTPEAMKYWGEDMSSYSPDNDNQKSYSKKSDDQNDPVSNFFRSLIG
jgi:hypothetical protein